MPRVKYTKIWILLIQHKSDIQSILYYFRTLLELLENVARSQKLRTSTRQQIVNKIAEKMDKKSHVDSM